MTYQPKTLPGALMAEVARVAALRGQYELGDAGSVAGQLMSIAIGYAIRSVDEWDVAAQIAALSDLRGFTE